MSRFVAGVAVGIVVLVIAEYVFLTQGGMPVAARNGRPLPLERFLTSRALHVAIVHDAARPSPVPADEPNLLAGARVYREQCATCHGGFAAQQRSPVQAGMFPRPPRLLPPAKGVTDDPVGETYWKVKNGLRLTGMPGFGGALDETALWQVSVLVQAADHLPASVVAALH